MSIVTTITSPNQVKWVERSRFKALESKIMELYRKIPYAGRDLLSIAVECCSIYEGYGLAVGGFPTIHGTLESLINNFEEAVLIGVKTLILHGSWHNEHITLQSNLTQVHKELYTLLTSLPGFAEVAKEVEGEFDAINPLVKKAALNESLLTSLPEFAEAAKKLESETESVNPQVENDALDESFLDDSDFTTL